VFKSFKIPNIGAFIAMLMLIAVTVSFYVLAYKALLFFDFKRPYFWLFLLFAFPPIYILSTTTFNLLFSDYNQPVSRLIEKLKELSLSNPNDIPSGLTKELIEKYDNNIMQKIMHKLKYGSGIYLLIVGGAMYILMGIVIPVYLINIKETLAIGIIWALIANAGIFIIFKNHIKRLFIRKKFKVEEIQFFNGKIEYYKNLNISRKKKFEKRVLKFIASKEISGLQDLQVTQEMKFYVAAAAITLSFGHDDYLFDGFDHIYISPDKYLSSQSNLVYQGETRPMHGTIILSWKHIKEGFEDYNDGLNIAMHEFAHALRYNLRDGSGKYQWIDTTWDIISEHMMNRIRSRENNFLRFYAGADEDELFAASVEAFFEQPEQFVKEMPAYYQLMSQIFNQNPINSINPVVN